MPNGALTKCLSPSPLTFHTHLGKYADFDIPGVCYPPNSIDMSLSEDGVHITEETTRYTPMHSANSCCLTSANVQGVEGKLLKYIAPKPSRAMQLLAVTTGE